MYFANKICLNLALFQLKNALCATPYCKIDGIKETEVETVSHYQMVTQKIWSLFWQMEQKKVKWLVGENSAQPC